MTSDPTPCYGFKYQGRRWLSERTPGVTLRKLFGFARDERIRLPQDFRRVMRTGRRLNSQNFVVFLKENQVSFHRLGIVVKRQVGPATFRNRVKRLVREFFRHHKSQIMGSFDIVLLVREKCSATDYGEIEKELSSLFFAGRLRLVPG